MTHIMIILGCAPNKYGRPSDFMMHRARAALALYKKHNYSKVILSGGPTKIKIPESEIMRIMLMHHIPDEKIIVEKNSKSIIQNAVFSWEIVKKIHPTSITIVTSEHHIPRTRYIFTKLYSHMKTQLIFEAAEDRFDIFESVYHGIKEAVLLLYIKIFGIR